MQRWVALHACFREGFAGDVFLTIPRPGCALSDAWLSQAGQSAEQHETPKSSATCCEPPGHLLKASP